MNKFEYEDHNNIYLKDKLEGSSQ